MSALQENETQNFIIEAIQVLRKVTLCGWGVPPFRLFQRYEDVRPGSTLFAVQQSGTHPVCAYHGHTVFL